MLKHKHPQKIENQLSATIQNKTVLITGGSAGIGKKTAEIFLKAGAHVILVARNPDKLTQAVNELSQYGQVVAYPCDLSDTDTIDELVARVLAEHQQVDVLINNAGRSIRRAIKHSIDRFHDYERTMQINYFGAVKLTNALLPSMVARKRGHIINISSYGVLSSSPLFSAYIASKAALDAYGRCLAAEVKHHGLHVTTLNFSLVRTEMIAPTKIYNYVPTLTSYDAAIAIAHAVIHRPSYDSTTMSKVAAVMTYAAPKANLAVQSFMYQLQDLTTEGGAKNHAKRLAKRTLGKLPVVGSLVK